MIEHRVEEIVRNLLREKEYVEFLVGRKGELDQLLASTVLRLKRLVGSNNSALALILPYMTAEFANNIVVRLNLLIKTLRLKAGAMLNHSSL